MSKMLPVLMGFVVAGAAWAQDTQVEDGKSAVTRAVESALGTGGLKFKGKVDNRSSDQMFQMFGMGRTTGFTGKFSATISSGTVVVTCEDKEGSFDIVKRGDKVVKRQVWEKEPRQIDEFAAEVGCLVDLEKVKANLSKAKLGKPETKEIDGKKITVVKGTMPLKLVGAEEGDDEMDPNDLMNWQKQMKLTTVEIKVEFRIAEDGSLTRLSYELGKRSRLLEMVKNQMGQMQGQNEDEEEDDDKPHATVSYTLDVEACGGDVKAEVPAELKKYFEK